MHTPPSHDSVASLLEYRPATGELLLRTPTKRRVAGASACRLDTKGYLRVRICGKDYKAHRIAWLLAYGEWPTGILDHINGDPADNRLCNLRIVSIAENGQNRKRAMRNNRTGLLGVSPVKGGFVAQIKAGTTKLRSRIFQTAAEAHAEYLRMKQEHHPANAA